MDVSDGVHGECGYCKERVGVGGEDIWLPLECLSCHQLIHIHCLKDGRPPVLCGDRLWLFTCAICHPLHKETCIRPHLQWVHVIHLVLYHLMVTQDGKDGYFRWNEDICGCIQHHWQSLMPHRRRTQSWHSTVAGTLSVHCPSLFQSGAKKLGESGYWTLTSLTPPELTPALKAGNKGVKLGIIEGESKQEVTPVVMEMDSTSSSSNITIQPSTTHFTASHPSLTHISTRQETILLNHLAKVSVAIGYSPKASRLRQKLKMRQRQRNHGYPTFDIDRHITTSLSSTVKYEKKPFSDQIVPILQQYTPPPPQSEYKHHTFLHHLSTFPILSISNHTPSSRLTTLLSGRGQELSPISSPFTARLLKPYIFRSRELRPPQVCLLQDIVNHYIIKHRSSDSAHSHTPYTPHSVDLCYLQSCHIAGCNGLLEQFFWSVDISDALNHPDFTCVALYGKLIVGCGFLTPDVRVGEAYISFLVVHPHFSRVGVGKMMLYHLIQSCRGKDITLHVSIDNPAMLMYQGFGFKAERYCLDFYDRYYPPSHPHSRHAYFMRLCR